MDCHFTLLDDNMGQSLEEFDIWKINISKILPCESQKNIEAKHTIAYISPLNMIKV